MRYIIDIPRWLDVKIKAILADEGSDYSSIGEFIVVACENQIRIEAEDTEVGSIEPVATEKNVPRKEKLEHLLSSDILAVSTVNSPSPDKVDAILLWGQVNRIFPIKLGTRVLANSLKDMGAGLMNLEDFRNKATRIAREFGLKLRILDKRKMRKPGEKLSTGLPAGSKAELSMNRYKAHYLAYQTGKGTLSGALADLRLANIEGDNIGITEKGLEFAKLSNPLLDSKEANLTMPLSGGEIKCFLSLVSEFLPDEHAFMNTVLGMIESGEPPREVFNSRVKGFLEKVWKREITNAVANTMRSGVLSRMWELKLVECRHVGKTVVYSAVRGSGGELGGAKEEVSSNKI